MGETLTKAAVAEGIAIVLTCLAGILEVWSIFAWSALLCVLVPLWITAISAATLTAIKESKDD